MLSTPRIIDLPRHFDLRGNLSVIEGHREVPFGIARSYWIYDVPGGQKRDGHAYRLNEEFIVALSGSFDVTVTNGEKTEKHSLNRSYYGIYIPNGWWRTLDNFSTNAVALVLASRCYEEEDYIYDFEEYLKTEITGDKEQRDSCADAKSDGEEEATENVLQTVALPKVTFREGNITAINGGIEIPFDIKRVFYSYDIPAAVRRGAHAHKSCHQFIIAAGGSFKVNIDNGEECTTVFLNRPFQGVHIPPGVWSEEAEFSSGSICLVLCSEPYDAEEYIRSYDEFKEYVRR